jgi:hypothetical protein
MILWKKKIIQDAVVIADFVSCIMKKTLLLEVNVSNAKRGIPLGDLRCTMDGECSVRNSAGRKFKY